MSRTIFPGSIDPYTQSVDSTLTWPELVTSTARVAPTTWVLEGPKGFDWSALLVAVSATARAFTPAFLSGAWVLRGLDMEGREVYTHRVQLGDSSGWMTAPDWDDASWTTRAANGVVSATPGGKQLTLANVAFPLPFDADVFYQQVEIPATATSVEVETQLPTTGDAHTGILWSGFAVDASGAAGQSNGGGIEQATAGTQQSSYFRNNAVFTMGGPGATARWCRSAWPLDDTLRTPAIIHQYMTDAGAYVTAAAYGMGGMALTPARHFGCWVNRRTADGSAYTIAVTLRLKVS